MELIYYTLAALVLYGVSDYILNTIEVRMGKRLPNRSFIFLIIITILAMVSFTFIRTIFAPLESTQQTTQTQTKPQTEQTITENISPAKTQQMPTDKETKK